MRAHTHTNAHMYVCVCVCVCVCVYIHHYIGRTQMKGVGVGMPVASRMCSLTVSGQ